VQANGGGWNAGERVGAAGARCIDAAHIPREGGWTPLHRAVTLGAQEWGAASDGAEVASDGRVQTRVGAGGGLTGGNQHDQSIVGACAQLDSASPECCTEVWRGPSAPVTGYAGGRPIQIAVAVAHPVMGAAQIKLDCENSASPCHGK